MKFMMQQDVANRLYGHVFMESSLLMIYKIEKVVYQLFSFRLIPLSEIVHLYTF